MNASQPYAINMTAGWVRRLVAAACLFLLIQPVFASEDSDEHIQWGPLLRESAMFLGVQHAFRFATEPGTRAGMKGPFFPGWYDAITSLHGWADGDPFLVNYVGHPMQGAVTGYIWVQNDPRYRSVRFGRDKAYWKGRLRAAAFAWAYSTQFELGPVSEASLGKIQSTHPQQGLVDHVATPSTGLLWMLGEDVMDRYVVENLERRISSAPLRAIIRTGLNPSRSFANVFRFKVPWYRDREFSSARYNLAGDSVIGPQEPTSNVRPSVQFSASAAYSRFQRDRGAPMDCIGGTSSLELSVSTPLSLIAEAGGCKAFNVEPLQSADAITFLTGPRLYLRSPNRLNLYAELLIGLQRVTVDQQPQRLPVPPTTSETSSNEGPPHTTNQVDSLAVAAGGGVELVIGKAISLRLADLRYSHSWPPSGDPFSFNSSLRLSSGLTFRFGTW